MGSSLMSNIESLLQSNAGCAEVYDLLLGAKANGLPRTTALAPFRALITAQQTPIDTSAEDCLIAALVCEVHNPAWEVAADDLHRRARHQKGWSTNLASGYAELRLVVLHRLGQQPSRRQAAYKLRMQDAAKALQNLGYGDADKQHTLTSY